MKRRLVALLVISILLGQLAVPLSAGASVADQTNLIKDLFKVPAQARLERETDGPASMVSWSLDEGDEPAFGQAVLKGTAAELSYYIEIYNAPRLAVDLKEAEARERVEAVITKMLPEKMTRVKLVQQPEKMVEEDGTFYAYYYQRFEGPIAVEGDGIQIIFNASTGRIVMFQQLWYEGSLPDQSGVITVKDAANAFAMSVPLQLEWLKVAGGKGDLKFHLKPVYRTAGYYFINAKTGSKIESYPFETIPAKLDVNSKPILSGAIDPDALISDAEALTVARREAQIPADYTLDYSYKLWVWGEQGRTNNFVFSGGSGQDLEKEVTVAIDMVTGRLSSIDSYSYFMEDLSPRYSYSNGRAKAQNLSKLMTPNEFSEMRLIEKASDYEYPEYEFARYIYGIPYRENGVNLQLDEYTGEISYYSYTWEQNITIPVLTTVLDEAEFRKTLSAKTEMQLVYTVQRNFDDQTSELIEEVKLCYIPKEAASDAYDAVSGEKVETEKAPPGVYGHWSEASFKALAAKGIIDSTQPVSPDKPINRADFTKMLVLATYLYPRETKAPVFADVGTGSPYLGYVEEAYFRGIVRGSAGKFNPDKPIARQEAAVILVKALKSEGRINPDMKIPASPFKDKNLVASWAAGDVNMAAELGYIKGFNGYFRPTSTITWAEAAALINSYISDAGV